MCSYVCVLSVRRKKYYQLIRIINERIIANNLQLQCICFFLAEMSWNKPLKEKKERDKRICNKKKTAAKMTCVLAIRPVCPLFCQLTAVTAAVDVTSEYFACHVTLPFFTLSTRQKLNKRFSFCTSIFSVLFLPPLQHFLSETLSLKDLWTTINKESKKTILSHLFFSNLFYC